MDEIMTLMNEERKRFNAEIITLEERNIRILGLGITSVSALVVAGSSFQLTEVFFLLPIITILFISIYNQNLNQIVLKTEYVKHAEEYLNLKLDMMIYFPRTMISSKIIKNRAIMLFTLLLNFSLIGISMYYSVEKINKTYDALTTYSSLALFLIVMIIYYIYLFKSINNLTEDRLHKSVLSRWYKD